MKFVCAESDSVRRKSRKVVSESMTVRVRIYDSLRYTYNCTLKLQFLGFLFKLLLYRHKCKNIYGGGCRKAVQGIVPSDRRSIGFEPNNCVTSLKVCWKKLVTVHNRYHRPCWKIKYFGTVCCGAVLIFLRLWKVITNSIENWFKE